MMPGDCYTKSQRRMNMRPNKPLSVLHSKIQENLKDTLETVEFLAQPLKAPLTTVEKSYLGLSPLKPKGAGKDSGTSFQDREGRLVYVSRRPAWSGADGKSTEFMATADYHDDNSVLLEVSCVMLYTVTGQAASSKFALEPSVTLGQPMDPQSTTGRMSLRSTIKALGDSGHHYLVPLLKYNEAIGTAKNTQSDKATDLSEDAKPDAESLPEEETFEGTVEAYMWLLPLKE